MFTGLVESVGRVMWLRKARSSKTELVVTSPELAKKLEIGDSIAINGCCLTVTKRKGETLSFDVLDETLNKTNLRDLRPDSLVNLERSMGANGRFGGHFVQGHIDCVAKVISFEAQGADHRLEIELPPEFAALVVYKGSIAVNGTSLTVAEVLPSSFVIWLIPHTLEETNLKELRTGATVNLEFDILAKYIERQLSARFPDPGTF